MIMALQQTTRTPLHSSASYPPLRLLRHNAPLLRLVEQHRRRSAHKQPRSSGSSGSSGSSRSSRSSSSRSNRRSSSSRSNRRSSSRSSRSSRSSSSRSRRSRSRRSRSRSYMCIPIHRVVYIYIKRTFVEVYYYICTLFR